MSDNDKGINFVSEMCELLKYAKSDGNDTDKLYGSFIDGCMQVISEFCRTLTDTGLVKISNKHAKKDSQVPRSELSVSKEEGEPDEIQKPS